MLNWIKQLFGASNDQRVNASQQIELTNFSDDVKLNGETMYYPENRRGNNSENAGEKTFMVLSNGVEMRLIITDEQMLVVSNNGESSPFSLSVPFNTIGTVSLADENLIVIIEPNDVFECAFQDMEQAEQAQQKLSQCVMRYW